MFQMIMTNETEGNVTNLSFIEMSENVLKTKMTLEGVLMPLIASCGFAGGYP